MKCIKNKQNVQENITTKKRMLSSGYSIKNAKNILTSVLCLAECNYNSSNLTNCINNTKLTWSILYKLINQNKNKNFLKNDITQNDFNKYFSEIGHKLADEIPDNRTNKDIYTFMHN